MDYESKIRDLKRTAAAEKRELTALELKRLAVWEEMARFTQAAQKTEHVFPFMG